MIKQDRTAQFRGHTYVCMLGEGGEYLEVVTLMHSKRKLFGKESHSLASAGNCAIQSETDFFPFSTKPLLH